MNDEILIRLLPAVTTIGLCIIIFLVIRGIWRAFKRFIFEVIDHANGTSSGTNTHARKKDYAAEARQACEKATPKRDKYATPPWEE